MEQAVTITEAENDAVIFADDAEDLQKSLERARKLALMKHNEKVSTGPEAVALHAFSTVRNQPIDTHILPASNASDNRVVFTKMDEFVWALHVNEEAQRPNHEDAFMQEDERAKSFC